MLFRSNTRFNRTVERQYDGSHMTYPGMGTITDGKGLVLKFFPHQNNVVWRMLTTGNTLMHVAVGLNGRTQPQVCEVIEFLAARGAKLDEMNGAGRTPIAAADNLPVDLAVDLLTKLITERGGVPKIPSKR